MRSSGTEPSVRPASNSLRAHGWTFPAKTTLSPSSTTLCSGAARPATAQTAIPKLTAAVTRSRLVISRLHPCRRRESPCARRHRHRDRRGPTAHAFPRPVREPHAADLASSWANIPLLASTS